MTEIALVGQVVELQPTGIRWLSQPSLDQYLALGDLLFKADQAYQWAIGDALVYGEDHFGEEWTQIQAQFRMSEGRMQSLASVARKIPRSRRRKNLTFTHHQEIAGKVDAPEQQKEWLDKAHGMTVTELRADLQEAYGWQERKVRPTVREAAKMVVEKAEPVEGGWLVSDEVYGRLCEATGQPVGNLLEGEAS